MLQANVLRQEYNVYHSDKAIHIWVWLHKVDAAYK